MIDVATCCPRCGVRLVGTTQISSVTAHPDSVTVSLTNVWISHECLRTARDQLDNHLQDRS